jgi:tetratricopeptide (TPR) repeat protein
MRKSTGQLAAPFLAAVFVILCVSSVKGAADLEVGDVVVARQSAPLLIAKRTIDTVDAGSALQVQFVRGNWLWVTNRKSGYIHDTQVMRSDEAKAAFARRIAVNRADFAARRARGYVRLLEGDTDGAIADFDAVLKLTSASPLFYFDRGTAWFSKGRYDRALADFDLAIQHQGLSRVAKSDQADLYCGRGLALLAAGHVEKAIGDFGTAIRVSEGRSATAHYRRGLAFLSRGNANERAIADFNRAIQLNSLETAAINARGLAWLRIGMFEKAAADFRRAIDASPNWPFVRSTSSGLFYKRLAASDDWQSDLIRKINPTDSAYYNLAILLAAGPDDVRDGAKARSWAEKACRLDKNRYYAFQEALAAAYAAEGRFDMARQRQQQAIALAPDEEGEQELKKQLADYVDGKPYRFPDDVGS